MMTPAPLWLLLGLTAATLRAGPVENAIVAAMKLSEASNYTWFTEVEDDARSYVIAGQTDLNAEVDLSLVNLPLVAAIRRGTGRGGGNSDNQATALFRGSDRIVIETRDGWKTPEELAAAGRAAASQRRPVAGRRPSRGGSAATAGRGRPSPPAYSNLQLTLSRPHEELGIIIAGYSAIQVEPDGVSGTLSPTSAGLLLVKPGQEKILPVRAEGRFRLWLKDGVLVKFHVALEGVISVETAGQRHEIAVNQTATTTVSRVGTTRFDVPLDAWKRLGG